MWQDISTAPRDGTWVMLTGGSVTSGWDGDDEPPVVCAQWSTWLNGREEEEGRWYFGWFDGGYLGQYSGPTHWMHVCDLPEPVLSEAESCN